MAVTGLFLSESGRKSIREEEGEINGLYDDPSFYCTFGVGHLVHKTNKWNCFLLEAASEEKEWTSFVKKKWPGKSYEVSYLDRPAAASKKFDELKKTALAKAKEGIAQIKHKNAFSKLTQAQQDKVSKLAENAVAEEARLLALTVDGVLKSDVTPFESAVRKGVKDPVKLNQDEFDALVSFSFNVGVTNFNNSSLLKKINENKHLSGDAKGRKIVIDAIEKEFLKWNKSGGKVLDGLTKRRQREANAFLKRAKEEHEKLTKSVTPVPGAPKPVGAPKALGSPRPVR